MPTAEEIVRHHPFDPSCADYVVPPQRKEIAVVAYDARWPEQFADLAKRILAALGATAIEVEHVGSTAVPGLCAKPIIDIDVTVADSREEDTYRARLEAAGFAMVLREPSWHQHRLFRCEHPPAHVHLWSPDCPEVFRHRLLRDWLIAHPEERRLYAEAKREAATTLNAAGGGLMMDYNQRKEPVIREILDRVFRDHGLL